MAIPHSPGLSLRARHNEGAPATTTVDRIPCVTIALASTLHRPPSLTHFCPLHPSFSLPLAATSSTTNLRIMNFLPTLRAATATRQRAEDACPDGYDIRLKGPHGVRVAKPEELAAFAIAREALQRRRFRSLLKSKPYPADVAASTAPTAVVSSLWGNFVTGGTTTNGPANTTLPSISAHHQ